MRVTGSGQALGATIDGLDLAQPLTDEVLAFVLGALGRYSVIRFLTDFTVCAIASWADTPRGAASGYFFK